MKTKSIRIDEKRNEVFVGGKRINLARKEFEILITLKNYGVTLSREVLIDLIWPAEKIPGLDSRTVDQHIARLRRKIGTDAIETVSCFGYRIAA